MQQVRTFVIDNQTIEYTLRKRRKQKSYSLAVQREGRITLTVPYWISLRGAEKFILEKKSWLLAVLQKYPQAVSTHVRKKHYTKHKEAARKFVQLRLAELNSAYGYTYHRVSIRVNTSRWGSCSEKGNLNFDYRIIFLPSHLQDYLLVHELCHLREMNHSVRFWNCVALTLPNHKELRKELQQQRL